jgi:hypothetical protein
MGQLAQYLPRALSLVFPSLGRSELSFHPSLAVTEKNKVNEGTNEERQLTLCCLMMSENNKTTTLPPSFLLSFFGSTCLKQKQLFLSGRSYLQWKRRADEGGEEEGEAGKSPPQRQTGRARARCFYTHALSKTPISCWRRARGVAACVCACVAFCSV